MLTVIIPMASNLHFADEKYEYPKPLIEAAGRSILDWALEKYISLPLKKKIIPIILKDDAKKYHLKDSLELLLGEDGKVVCIDNETSGAICTVLMSIAEIDMDCPLIVASYDQVIDCELHDILQYFDEKEWDAGLITFSSVHPKWSFAKLGDDGLVVQTSEKKPISTNAIAGLYYFKRGSDFVEAAKNVMLKGATTNGAFYVSSTMNELVLKNKAIGTYAIDSAKYTNFYDSHAVSDFEEKKKGAEQGSSAALKWTDTYVRSFRDKDIGRLADFFDDSSVLRDPSGTYTSRGVILSYLQTIFSEHSFLSFDVDTVHESGVDRTILEFDLTLSDVTYTGVDIITWREGIISEMNAYLYERGEF